MILWILGQRISPPNKTKTQLQICKHNEEQATFVFVNPLGKEASFDLSLFTIDSESIVMQLVSDM